MLEGVLVVLNVVVVVVGIGEEVILRSEDVGRAEVGTWQACPNRFLYLENLFGIVGKVLA